MWKNISDYITPLRKILQLLPISLRAKAKVLKMTSSLPSNPISILPPTHTVPLTLTPPCSKATLGWLLLLFLLLECSLRQQHGLWTQVSSDLYSNATSVSLSLVTTQITNPNTSCPTSLRPPPQKVTQSNNEQTFCSSLLNRWIWSLLVCLFSSETKGNGKMKSSHLTHRGSNSSKGGNKLMDLLILF